MIRSFVFLSLAVSLMMLTGCGSSGGGAGYSAATDDSLAMADLSTSEAGLVAQRILAAESVAVESNILANVVSADLAVADVIPTSAVQYQGRQYRGGQQGARRRLYRGTNGCPVDWDASTGRLFVGSESCSVTAVENGYQITRANGDSIIVTRPVDGSLETTMIINGVEWQVTFSEDPALPLLVMINSRSGRTLTIDEDDAGTLTIATDGIARYRGGWLSDGTLDAEEFGQQARRRYRRCA